MEYSFFKPTKYKLVTFILVSIVLMYLPVVPVVMVPGIEQPQMVMESAISGIQSMEIPGTGKKTFGMFAGTEAGIMNILYVIVAGYVIACILLYGYHKMHG